MEKICINIASVDVGEVRQLIQFFVLKFEPPFTSRLRLELKPYLNPHCPDYIVTIAKSRNVHVIASANLHRIGFYAADATVTSFQKLRM